MSLRLKPITFRQMCAYVEAYHRHHKPPRGHKFSIGVVDDNGELQGVISIGRPVARAYDDGFTAEVNRSCTTGYPNANSMLYGAAWRAAKAMGYTRCITYTQEGETGSSIKAAGFRKDAELAERPGSWAASCSRTVSKDTNSAPRVRWVITSKDYIGPEAKSGRL